MTFSIKRLRSGDALILAALATDEADFDMEGDDGPSAPLDGDAGRRFLANPAVLVWVAQAGDEIVGFLYCTVVPLRSGRGQELLLYDVATRRGWRRQGVGRALLAQMEQWMQANGIDEVWVLADGPGADDFYRACGFRAAEEQPVYMTRTLRAAD